MALALGLRGTDPALVGVSNVDLVFLTAVVGRGGALRPAAVAAGQRRQRRWPTTSSSCRRSTPSPSPIPTNVVAFVLLHGRGGDRQQPGGPRRAPRPWRRATRARTTETLYAFSRKLAGVGTLDDVLWATAYQIA